MALNNAYLESMRRLRREIPAKRNSLQAVYEGTESLIPVVKET